MLSNFLKHSSSFLLYKIILSYPLKLNDIPNAGLRVVHSITMVLFPGPGMLSLQ